MDRALFARIKHIYLAIADLEPDARDSYLDEHAGDDVELREEVLAWLAFDQPVDVEADTGSKRDLSLSIVPGARSALTDAGETTLSVGDVVARRYEIESFIDRGGMGEVYRAVDRDLGARVALKTVRPDIASNPEALRRFKREVLLARSVTHANVCRIYDLGRDEPRGLSFLTMELLEGETLEELLRTSGAMSLGRSLRVARQLAGALDAAHRAGVVHRDFKSANVMIESTDAGERAVIMDFGLAVSEETRPGEAFDEGPDASQERASSSRDVPTAGTPAYMSPEQVASGAVGPSSDRYSFGVVLYEMTTGRLPFDGPDAASVARARLTEDPTPPSAHVPLPDAWEETILRLLSRDAGQRYESAGDAIVSIEGAGKPEPTVPHELPAERDTFVGRRSLIERIADDLEVRTVSAGSGPLSPHRLLTLVGPPGVGKTRLALKYAWESLARWPGGIRYCDLSEARSADGVAGALGAALDIPLISSDPVGQLGHAIASLGRSLLVLDSFERATSHAEVTLGRWLDAAPDVSFLVTSRERLRLPDESALEVTPLEPRGDGLALFEARARQQRPGFHVNDENRELVGDIVEALDGLPLAVELAASRLRTLSLSQLAERLHDRFSVLTGGRRGRHETLRTALEWSWEQLTPRERSALGQASLFEGGFTLEAAEAVVDLSAHGAGSSMLDVVQSLCDKSWLRTRTSGDVPRFEMYATVAEFAARALDAADPVDGMPARADVERAHGAYYAASTVFEVSGEEWTPEAQRRARQDLDNVIAACLRAADRNDAAMALDLLGVAWSLLELSGPASKAIDCAERVLRIEPLAAAERARAGHLLARARESGGQLAEAVAELEEVLALFREIGERTGEGEVLADLSGLTHLLGRTQDAREYADAALSIATALGDRQLEARVLRNLGVLDFTEGDVDSAREGYERSLAIYRETGPRRLEAMVTGTLANLHKNQGRATDARALYARALQIFRELGDRRGEAATINNQAGLELRAGNLEEAMRRYREALVLDREIGNRGGEGGTLANLGNVLRGQDRLEEAQAHYEAAIEAHRETGNRHWEAIAIGNLANVHDDQGHTEEARRWYGEALAIHREVGHRGFEGLTLSGLAFTWAREGRWDEARRHFEEAMAIHREMGDLDLEGAIHRNIAYFLRERGEITEATEHAERSIETLRRGGGGRNLPKSTCLLGMLRLDAGDLDGARACLDEAERSVAELGAATDGELADNVADLRESIAAAATQGARGGTD